MRRMICLLIIFLSGCTFSSNSYFIRWWNGNLPHSNERRQAWSDCLDESKIKYSSNIDPIGEKRTKYIKACMKQKGHW